MSEHLSSEQIVNWMIEDHSAEQVEHVGVCAECAAAVERLEQSLGMFRVAVRETAQQLGESQKVFHLPRRPKAVLWLTAGLTAAAVLVSLTALPVYKVQQEQRKAEMARQDAELMEQVDAELSEGVAAPMRPLEKMVSWGPAAKQSVEKRKF
jgi:hypothetical protein